MSKERIVKFGGLENPSFSIPGWTVVSGKPEMESYFQYRSADDRILSGTWKSTIGKYHTIYADPKMYEFVHLIEGKLIITPNRGEAVILRPGDAFVVEPGFDGTWEVVEPVRKHFVLST